MLFISKRRLRILALVLGIGLLVSLSARAVVQFQLGQEIEHYRTFFKTHKDNIHDIFDPLSIKQIPYETINALYESRKAEGSSRKSTIAWDNYAYVNYVTEPEYLCNTVMQFKRLKELKTKAKLVALISRDLVESENEDKRQTAEKLIAKLSELAPEQVIVKTVDNIVKPEDSSPWKKSLTKLLVFNQTEFDRIIYLDSDAAVYSNMDELFFLPSYVTFAAPLTYWFLSDSDLEEAKAEIRAADKATVKLENIINSVNTRVRKGQQIYNHLPVLPSSLVFHSSNVGKEILDSTSSASPLFRLGSGTRRAKVRFSSNLMVITPKTGTFDSIVQYLLPVASRQKDQYDIDLINNKLYNLKAIIHEQFLLFRKLKSAFTPEVMVLPFREYGLLSSSIKNKMHHELLANELLGYEGGLASSESSWKELVKKSKYIHYSDWPVSKPWLYAKFDQLECHPETNADEEKEMCEVWNSVYRDYWDSRYICQL
ncbi:LADA_0D03158g1_1 [Lachancea dasiensis]|uniref:LADA_0D03158g1_1 n=1 Tax=Lachancea dasiensis TaxID=1072105 RepID=A0A1G4J4W4_9SACH|nr:LADA_0D03158g1_1 [Lachancea dasiensis]